MVVWNLEFGTWNAIISNIWRSAIHSYASNKIVDVSEHAILLGILQCYYDWQKYCNRIVYSLCLVTLSVCHFGCTARNVSLQKHSILGNIPTQITSIFNNSPLTFFVHHSLLHQTTSRVISSSYSIRFIENHEKVKCHTINWTEVVYIKWVSTGLELKKMWIWVLHCASNAQGLHLFKMLALSMNLRFIWISQLGVY